VFDENVFLNRLWQDAQTRAYLIQELDKRNGQVINFIFILRVKFSLVNCYVL
jgi:predicted DNA-binding ribbon-helix-helix protein